MIKRLALIVVLAVLLVSCGQNAIGYGVVMWSDDEKVLQTATIVTVLKESEIYDTYTLTLGDKKVSVPRWQLMFFGSREDAEGFLAKMGRFASVYATATVNALRIRQNPNQTADVVYKLAEGERVKVISGPVTDKDGMSWLEVYTKGGIRGFTAASYLKTQTKHDKEQLEPDIVSRFISSTWRPLYFKEMIENNEIDVYRFGNVYGLFTDKDKGIIRIDLPKLKAEFPFSRILPVSSQELVTEGSNVRIVFTDENEISVQFPYGNKNKTEFFYATDEDMDLIAANEISKREDEFKSLIKDGNRLASNSYGILTINEDKTFKWERNSSIRGKYIPSYAANTGKIDISVIASASLRKNYDGVIGFYFDKTDKSETLYFLYKKESGGIRLYYLSHDAIEDNIVVREPSAPIVLYFTYLP
ncbi:SH3 domain-containing protein [Spirochaetia bacterium 38H-sp]|uniref:SH3 domain-containing protein n=1 Tax=Rarispira pelagica TaxID=3141764 RepID=A0ABU9UCB0_9SPIR